MAFPESTSDLVDRAPQQAVPWAMLHEDLLGSVFGCLSLRDRLCDASAVNRHWRDCKTAWTSLYLEDGDTAVAAIVQRIVVCSLESLTCWGDLTDAGLLHLSGLTQLRELLLSCITFTDSGLQHLATLKQLRSLAIPDGIISNKGLRHVASLEHLEHLNLTGCSGFTVRGLGRVTRALVRLQHLDLTDWHLTDGELTYLGSRLPIHLLRLNLSGSFRLQGPGLKVLSVRLVHLQHLDMQRCRGLTARGWQHVARMTHLRHLSLQHCRPITAAGWRDLSSLTHLQHLDVAACGLVDTDLQHLSSLRELQHLDISDCGNITEAGLEQLLLALPPDCEVLRDMSTPAERTLWIWAQSDQDEDEEEG